MDYDDMDDGQNLIYWATGVPPQEHLDDIDYKGHTSMQLYRRVIKRIKSGIKPSGNLINILRKVKIKKS